MTPEQVALIEQHRAYAISVGRRMWRRYPGAVWSDDLDSAALEGLIQAAQSWDGRGSFSGWSRTRISGSVLDEVRRLIQWGARGKPQPPPLPVGDSDQLDPRSDRTNVYGSSDMRRVDDILALVEERSVGGHRREVARLALREGYSYAEVAERIGSTEGAVAAMMVEIRRQLQVALRAEQAAA